MGDYQKRASTKKKHKKIMHDPNILDVFYIAKHNAEGHDVVERGE